MMLSLTLCMGLFTGCGSDLGSEASNVLTPKLYANGNVNFEESKKGIYSGDPDIVSKMKNGTYYVYHDEYFYPVSYDWKNYEKLDLGSGPEPEGRQAAFDTSTVIDIPTLFKGDELFYFSTAGVYDYTTLERFTCDGWSIGLNKLETNTTGRVFFEPQKTLEEGIKNGNMLTTELSSIYDYIADKQKASDGKFSLDKVGGVSVDENNVKNGILTGLERGKAYDLEIYSGTDFMHYPASASVMYLRSMETYAIWEATPLQDYLYQIKVPSYLKTGYYDVGGTGFMRIVRGSYYNKKTDYNEQLLFPYYEPLPEDATKEDKLEAEKEKQKKAGMYSKNEKLNTFIAMDKTCFGYRAPKDEENEESTNTGDGANLDKFFEASTTKTGVWLPDGKAITINIATEETTGSVYLEYKDGSQRKIPYDRLIGGYVVNLTGTGKKADIVVKGLYKEYKIKLTNAESYKGQDGASTVEETNSGN